MNNIIKQVKKIRRKTWGFFAIVLLICAPAAWKFGITWPLAALTGGIYLIFAGAISAEKTILAWIEKKPPS